MISIQNNSGGACCGYIFELEKKSVYEGCIKIDNTTTVVLVKDSSYIYLNSHSEAAASNPLEEQFDNLQKALDYLSLRGIQNSSVRVPFGHYFSWQLLEEGYTLKLTERTISLFSITSDDISKLEVQNYHEGFRFFRFAQIAHDLYDAYRNLWLSFESLITTHTPRKINKNGKPDESEESWYCRALNELAQETKNKELNDLLLINSSEILMRELYKNTRCLLFHSKFGESKFIPHNIEQHRSVKSSLTQLTIILTAILMHYYSIQTRSSWLNPDMLIDVYKDMFEGTRLVVDDIADEKALSDDSFGELITILASDKVFHLATKHDCHVEHLFTSSITVNNIDSQKVRRFSFVKEDKELIIFTLDEDLSLEGVANLELESSLDLAYIEKARSYDFRI